MITVEQVEFHYADSQFQLAVPEFRVAAGEAVALVGPSGSGKTTLLNLVAGILVPDTGKVESGGVCVSSLSESARRDQRVQNMGLVFQEFELLEHLNVLDNILLPCRISSRLKISQELRERAAELAEGVGIGDKLRRRVRKLSQGERQRVALCRALLVRPPLLLCDEPTGNLDPANKSHVLDILFDYVRESGATMLTVTHDHDLLGRFDATVDVSTFHATGA